MIVVLDYGMGNLMSVTRALSHLHAEHRIQTDLSGASKLIIPGVGAFGSAMERLHPLADEIRAFAHEGGPLLGLCLGQQLLFEESEELGHTRGLGILKGRVRYLQPEGLKVPHMGWSRLTVFRESPLTSGIRTGDHVYFVHSLITECDDPSDVVAIADYGQHLAAMVARKNVWATQFHPEKSGPVGLRILENFVKC